MEDETVESLEGLMKSLDSNEFIGLLTPPIDQYQLYRHKENDSHNKKININELASIKILLLSKGGIILISYFSL